MNKTFYPNSYIHMTCCFLPHNIFPISDSFIIILPAFPIMLHFAVLPIFSSLFCPPHIFLTLHLSWGQCQKFHWPNSEAIPWNHHLLHLSPPQLSFSFHGAMQPSFRLRNWKGNNSLHFFVLIPFNSRGILLPVSLSKLQKSIQITIKQGTQRKLIRKRSS